MKKVEMVKDATVDIGYEFYQTIIDFDHPIQIFREAFQNSIDESATEVYCRVFTEKTLGQEDLYIDIWDNGTGLRKEHAECFFGLAKSTKVDKNKTPLAGKLGYKGHGTKIFFRSERIEIYSKMTNGQVWGAVLEDAVKQIRDSGGFKYSDVLTDNELSISLPKDFKSGFYLRIKNPTYFKTQHTRFMLNHMYLRDYSKWFTVFGNVRHSFVKQDSKPVLFLQGLNIDYIKTSYSDFKTIDPIPEFVTHFKVEFEKIQMGHYFPDERATDKEMEKYAKRVGANKSYSLYYSKLIFQDRVYLDSNLYFDFTIFVEGYETKRRYDVLLSRKGTSPIDKSLLHTDGERYGLWACKGGVPIEKVDDWIFGGTGVGTYTYMHAFIDCNAFELTGTRGSIRNSDLEIQEKVKDKINGILSDKKIQNDLAERQEWQQQERTLRSIGEDEQELKKRFRESQGKRIIQLPSGHSLTEPTKGKSGYSESETLILLIQLMTHYPNLFPFKLLDYNTTKGIDFIVQKSVNPFYVELKGTLQNKINHSFRHIYKFVCYDVDLKDGDILSDIEDLKVGLKINRDDKFQSLDDNFKEKKFTSYQLQPISSVIQSMEIVVLKKILEEIVEAKIS
ncbi:MAG: ATP-binding protein [Bacteroidota bacterium]|nr:ATP-binding protein [Bacteroidota bacterium]